MSQEGRCVFLWFPPQETAYRRIANLICCLNHADANHLVERVDGLCRVGGDVSGHIEDGVGVFLAGFARHVLNVYTSLRQYAGEAADGVGNVAVHNADALPSRGMETAGRFTELRMFPFSR